jgi:hypothetical protein
MSANVLSPDVLLPKDICIFSAAENAIWLGMVLSADAGVAWCKKDDRVAAVLRVNGGGVSWRLTCSKREFTDVSPMPGSGLIYFIRGLDLDLWGSLHLTKDLWQTIMVANKQTNTDKQALPDGNADGATVFPWVDPETKKRKRNLSVVVDVPRPDKHGGESEESTPPKRKRGRPKKVPGADPVQTTKPPKAGARDTPLQPVGKFSSSAFDAFKRTNFPSGSSSAPKRKAAQVKQVVTKQTTLSPSCFLQLYQKTATKATPPASSSFATPKSSAVPVTPTAAPSLVTSVNVPVSGSNVLVSVSSKSKRKLSVRKELPMLKQSIQAGIIKVFQVPTNSKCFLSVACVCLCVPVCACVQLIYICVCVCVCIQWC